MRVLWLFLQKEKKMKKRGRTRKRRRGRRGALIRKRGCVEAVAVRQATGAGSRTKGCLLP